MFNKLQLTPKNKGPQKLPRMGGAPGLPSDPSRIEAALSAIFARLDELREDVIKLFQKIAHVERLLRELKVRLLGKDPKERGVIPAQFMYSAKPGSGAAPTGRKRESIENRAISAAFQRTVYDSVPCPNHGAYPKCMCAVTGSLTIGSFAAPIPRFTF